jgi:anti-sigma regulatory factor (Ser/Thr protein kinase)
MDLMRGAAQAPAADWEGTYTLPISGRSAALARMLIRQALADCLPEVMEDAELMVSELVTNGIQHAGTRLTLHIQPAHPGFRVGVEDGSSDHPIQRTATAAETRGRGLQIVDDLASAWGWHLTPVGKQVWFEVQ